MKENGYHTVMITAHPGFPPQSRLGAAFDECIYLKIDSSRREKGVPYATFEEVNAALDDWLDRPHSEPFFLYVHTMDTHFPHKLKSPHDLWLNPVHESSQIDFDIGEPVSHGDNTFSKADLEYLRGLYDGSIRCADHGLQALLASLDERRLTPNTMVIVGSDHGEMLGEDGVKWGHATLVSTDLIMQVPLIMVGPGIPEGHRVSVLTENVDIVPTLIDLLGLQTDARTDGTSLVPLLRGETSKPVRDYAFAKFFGIDGGTPTFILRNATFKYELNWETQEEHLWRLPDTVFPRRDCLDEDRAVADTMRAYVMAKLEPLWGEYQSRPDVSIHLRFNQDGVRFEPEEAIEVTAETDGNPDVARAEGKWLLQKGSLRGFPGAGNAPPPVTLHCQVRNGDYLVQISLLCTDNLEGLKASAFNLKVEDDTGFRLVRGWPRKGETYSYFDAGEYSIKDGSFDVELAVGNPSMWAIANGFRLVPVDWQAKDTQKDSDQRREALEALGYLE
ncbi:MAG TPA: sulfatase-like hydrolase/transferase [Candidatus Hydrogenedentes bacterium]|nr:sulfatase-like hydrolase/transferase [Candidatus Hydrogenedentota bacterium]HPG68561.1 sulfatase-like hydrolase/transferase [Candidatus Hydrogenedentota bacterium]